MPDALKNFKTYCSEHDLRITPPRIAVYDIVVTAQKPMTAYEVLEALGQKLDSPKPPTAYRALEFLQKHGFVHRIESLNAYIACGAGHRHHGSQFMICDSCNHVEEAHLCHVPKGLNEQIADKGFQLSYWNAELHGTCKNCGGR